MKINQLLQSLKLDTKYDTKSKTQTQTTSESVLENYKSKNNQVNQLASKYQVTLTEKDVKAVDDFMQKSDGTESSKLQTVEVAMYKGIELTEDNLTSIHSALNESPDMAQEILVDSEMTADATPLDEVVDGLKLPIEIKTELKGYLAEGKTVSEAVKLVAEKLISDAQSSGNLDAATLTKFADQMDSKSLTSFVESLNKLMDQMPELKAIISSLSEVANGIAAETDGLNQQIQVLIEQIENSRLNQTKTAQNDGISTDSTDDNNASNVSDVSDASMASALKAMIKLMLNRMDAQVGQTSGDRNAKEMLPTHPELSASTLSDILSQENTSDLASSESKAINSVSGISINGEIELEGSGLSTDGATDVEGTTGVDEMSVDGDETANGLDEDMLLEVLSNLLTELQTVSQSIESTFDVKTYIVETVTEKSLALQEAFEAEKTQLINLTNPEIEQTPETVQKAINAMEKLLMKSEVSLYSDMQTEKDLLKLSSQLEEAKSQLSAGNQNKALATLKDVHSALKEIQINMNPRKLQSVATERIRDTYELLKSEDKAQKETTTIKEQVQTLLDQQKDASGSRSGRDVLEILRGLGLNHEMEVSEELSTGSKQVKAEWMSDNVKEILMKLIKEDTSNRTIEQTLLNLTGQQMMNDSDQRGQQRFQFFNLPFEDDAEVNNMKVYMTGKNKQNVLDDQNASLYFGMNLKNLGETGISVQIQEGQINMTVMNDNKEAFEEAFGDIQTELQEIGFEGVNIKFEAYREEKPFALQGEVKQEISYQYDEKKGFDFKI